MITPILVLYPRGPFTSPSEARPICLAAPDDIDERRRLDELPDVIRYRDRLWLRNDARDSRDGSEIGYLEARVWTALGEPL